MMDDSPCTPCLVQEHHVPRADVKREETPPPSVPSLENETPPLVENQDADATTSSPSPPPRSLYLDDVDRMLCHEDFGSLLALAVRVKQVRDAISLDDIMPSSKRAAASEMDPQQVINAVTRMQQQHLLRNYQDAPIITRGTYHMTDSLLNENFHILQEEMERCNKWISSCAAVEKQNSQQEEEERKSANTKKTKSEGGDAIAVKYAKWQTDVLMEWMLEHIEHPFPDQQQMKQLCETTGLSHAQVVNWTTNVRKRSLKATVENGKKPHHFIDFCFLAKDREKQHSEKVRVKKRTPAVTKHKKKSAAYRGGPYTSAIHGHHPGYQQPTTSHFRPHHHASGGYYAGMHPQTMMQHHGYYPGQHQQEQQPPTPYPYPPISYYQPPQQQMVQQQYSERGEVEDFDWDDKVRAVSESFDESANNVPGMVDDPLLTFAQLWGGDDELRDDVHQDEEEATFEPEELEDASINMDVFMDGIENQTQNDNADPQLQSNGGFTGEMIDQLLQHGKCDFTSSGTEAATDEPLLHDEPFQAFPETSGMEVAFRSQQRRRSSFSIDMEEFEGELNMDSDMDIGDFLVEA